MAAARLGHLADVPAAGLQSHWGQYRDAGLRRRDRTDLQTGAGPVPPPSVIALADEVRARLAQGNLAGRGPIELVPNGGLLDAELAARVVLADVAHCTQRGWEESAGRYPHARPTDSRARYLAV